MKRPSRRPRKLKNKLAVRRLATIALIVGALSGCFESDEERALAAYEAHEFASAAALSERLAATGNPRGYHLLSLMAAQGLGREVDFAAALVLADQAAALDSTYAATRDAVTALIAAMAAGAQAAFEAEDFERAFALAKPLDAFGHAGARSLRRRLITGHYVALPGSALAWLTFWHTCSGNTRYESDTQSDATFAAKCLGRAVVWDGTVVRVFDDKVNVKMKPGRPGARYDLRLELLAPDEADVRPGAKMRFSGVIDARGTPSRADKLVAARLIEAAPLTDKDLARDTVIRQRAAMAACQKLAEARFRAGYMPDWAIEIEAKVRAGGSPGSRAFSLFVGVVSEADAFTPTADGGWHGVFDGTVTIQSVVARAAQVTKFTADCTVDASFERGKPLEEHAALEFVTIDEPVLTSAPARLLTPRRGE